MALRKKQRVLSIQISKISTPLSLDSNSSDYYEEIPISGIIKIPFVRTHLNCSKCVFFKDKCAVWNPKIEVAGLIGKNGYLKCECRNDYFTEYRFNYMVTSEIAFKYLSYTVLKVLGLYEEPKLKNSRSNKTNHIFNQLKAQYSYSKYSKPKNYNFRKH